MAVFRLIATEEKSFRPTGRFLLTVRIVLIGKQRELV